MTGTFNFHPDKATMPHGPIGRNRLPLDLLIFDLREFKRDWRLMIYRLHNGVIHIL